MTSHVPPHRWADAWAGRVDDDERAEMERHAQACDKCARAKKRVMRASDSFAQIRNQVGPELPWDSVRARVHWTVSKERRSQPKVLRPRRRWGLVAAGALAVGGLAAIGIARLQSSAPDETAQPIALPAPAVPVVAAAEPLFGLVNRSTGEVMLDGLRAKPGELFARRLGPGAAIATADGELDVQFGAASAFRLGPRSKVELRRFDSQAIELAIEGRVDLSVAPRAAGQRFVVRAGDREIEVRGTQFRVVHVADATTVACRQGLVAVRDPHGEVEVAGKRRLELSRGRRVIEQQVKILSSEELHRLAEAAPVTLPVWELGTLASSAPLEIATAGRREIRLDGVELGEAPMAVRVMPGRHTVEAADGRGRYRRAGWIDVAAPGTTQQPARLEVLPEPLAPTRGVDERKKQLRAGIDKARLAECTRRIAKAGLAGTYVEIEIGVDAQGSLSFLNVLDTDTGHATAQCIRDVLAEVPFKPGPAAQWRQRIDL